MTASYARKRSHVNGSKSPQGPEHNTSWVNKQPLMAFPKVCSTRGNKWVTTEPKCRAGSKEGTTEVVEAQGETKVQVGRHGHERRWQLPSHTSLL